MLPADTPAGDRFVNAYWTTRVVDSMRRTGHGGIVLLVPSGPSDWRDALSDAPRYQCSPPFRGLRDALDRLLPNPYAVHALIESEHLQYAADTVGQVTAVDGATVLDMDLRVLAFGAMVISPSATSSASKRVARKLAGSRAPFVTLAVLDTVRQRNSAAAFRKQSLSSLRRTEV